MIGAPTHRYESTGFVHASVDEVFAHLDDHTRAASHMSEPSWMLGGGRMETELDEGLGQRVGSRIRLAGRVFGVELLVEEIVTERDPPRRKVWETTGTPKLLVMGHYRMGFALSSSGKGAALRVFIEYALPATVPTRWLGRVLSRFYARWCTQQMVTEAIQHFAARTVVG